MADPRSGEIEACVFKIVLIQQVTVPEIRAVGRTRLQHLRQLDRNLRCFRLCVNPSDHVCVSTGAHLFPAPLPFPSRVCQAPWAGHGWQSAWKPADIVPDERRAGWRQRDCCSASKSEDTNVDVLLYWVYGPGHYTQVLYIIVSLFRLYFFFFLSETAIDFPDTLCQGAAGFGCADYTPAFALSPLLPKPSQAPRRDISKHSLQISGQQRPSRPCTTFTCGCVMGRSHTVTCCFKLPGATELKISSDKQENGVKKNLYLHCCRLLLFF